MCVSANYCIIPLISYLHHPSWTRQAGLPSCRNFQEIPPSNFFWVCSSHNSSHLATRSGWEFNHFSVEQDFKDSEFRLRNYVGSLLFRFSWFTNWKFGIKPSNISMYAKKKSKVVIYPWTGIKLRINNKDLKFMTHSIHEGIYPFQPYFFNCSDTL